MADEAREEDGKKMGNRRPCSEIDTECQHLTSLPLA
jgi:hypothetical protein